MHKEAYEFLAAQADGDITHSRGLDIGGRTLDMNMRPRRLWPHVMWEVVDIYPPTEHDSPETMYGRYHQQDFFRFIHQTTRLYDIIICTEVFEHTPHWKDILTEARYLLSSKRSVIFATCATTGRQPHSAIDGGELQENEHYQNIETSSILTLCRKLKLRPTIQVNTLCGDLYLTATPAD
jgi:Methyltransferase domain